MKYNPNVTFNTIMKDPTNVSIFSIASLTILISFLLNLFIIVQVIIDKSMRNYTNIQFASMSCADSLVTTIAMPCMLLYCLYGYWPLSDNACIIFILGDFVGGNISIITLTVISYHRYKCIKRPFIVKKNTIFESLMPSFIIWPAVILFWTIPAIIIVQQNKKNNKYMNTNHCFYMHSFIYVLIVDIVAYVLPVVLLVFLQFSIYRLLKKKASSFNPILYSLTQLAASDAKNNKIGSLRLERSNTINRLNEISVDSPSVISPTATSTTMVDAILVDSNSIPLIKATSSSALESHSITTKFGFNKSNKIKQKKMRAKSISDAQHKIRKTLLNNFNNNMTKNRKAFRTLLFVTCFLIVFWVPWIITWPIGAYCNCVPDRLYSITYWMEYSNSFTNSIILITGNQHFRKKFISMFRFRKKN